MSWLPGPSHLHSAPDLSLQTSSGFVLCPESQGAGQPCFCRPPSGTPALAPPAGPRPWPRLNTGREREGRHSSPNSSRPSFLPKVSVGNLTPQNPGLRGNNQNEQNQKVNDQPENSWQQNTPKGSFPEHRAPTNQWVRSLKKKRLSP